MTNLCEECGKITNKKAEFTAMDGKKVCKSCNEFKIIEDKIQRKERYRRVMLSMQGLAPAH